MEAFSLNHYKGSPVDASSEVANHLFSFAVFAPSNFFLLQCRETITLRFWNAEGSTPTA